MSRASAWSGRGATNIPITAMPGPAIGFLQEATRFWDHWLKGVDTGIMKEPMLRAWVQESLAPAAHYDHRPGYWAGEPAWPAADIHQQACTLRQEHSFRAWDPKAIRNCAPAANQTSSSSTSPHRRASASMRANGVPMAWAAFRRNCRSTSARRMADRSSSRPSRLEHDITILGAPVVMLAVESDQPDALVAVRLNDLRPDGGDLRVSYGVLNLTHLGGHDRPAPLEPGKVVNARVQLREIGHIFPAGHRIRIAISTAYWPTIWPSPRTVRLRVHTGGSQLLLPVRRKKPPMRRSSSSLRSKAAAPHARCCKARGRNARSRATWHTNELVYTVVRDDGRGIIDEIGVETGFEKKYVYRINPDRPDQRAGRFERGPSPAARQGVGYLRRCPQRLDLNRKEFLVEATLKVYEKGKPFFVKSWLERIPRKNV